MFGFRVPSWVNNERIVSSTRVFNAPHEPLIPSSESNIEESAKSLVKMLYEDKDTKVRDVTDDFDRQKILLSVLIPAANKGDVKAQIGLAMLYYIGHCEARKYFNMARTR